MWQRNCYGYFTSTVNSTGGNWWNRGRGHGQQVQRWNTKTKESGIRCTLAWLPHFLKQRKKQTTAHQFEQEQGDGFLCTLERGLYWPITAEMLTRNKHCVRSLLLNAAMGCFSEIAWRQKKNQTNFETHASRGLIVGSIRLDLLSSSLPVTCRLAEWNPSRCGRLVDSESFCCDHVYRPLELTLSSTWQDVPEQWLSWLRRPSLRSDTCSSSSIHAGGWNQRSTRCEAVASVAALCSFARRSGQVCERHIRVASFCDLQWSWRGAPSFTEHKGWRLRWKNAKIIREKPRA